MELTAMEGSSNQTWKNRVAAIEQPVVEPGLFFFTF